MLEKWTTCLLMWKTLQQMAVDIAISMVRSVLYHELMSSSQGLPAHLSAGSAPPTQISQRALQLGRGLLASLTNLATVTWSPPWPKPWFLCMRMWRRSLNASWLSGWNHHGASLSNHFSIFSILQANDTGDWVNPEQNRRDIHFRVETGNVLRWGPY